MSSRILTLDVPGPVIAQIRKRARQANRSVEAEAVDLLAGAVSNGESQSSDLDTAIAEVSKLDNDELRQSLTPLMTPKQTRRLAELNRKAQAKGLSVAEKAEQNQLFQVYDKSMIVRAAVMAELKRRGFNVAEMIAT